MSESQTPKINAQAYWYEDKHVVDYETAFEIEKELLAELAATRARLAERNDSLVKLISENVELKSRLAELEGIAERLSSDLRAVQEEQRGDVFAASIRDFAAYKEGKK